MTFESKPFAFTTKEFATLQANWQMYRTRWMGLALVILGSALLIFGRSFELQALGVFGIVYLPLFVLLSSRGGVKGRTGRLVTLTRTVRFDGETLETHVEDGSYGRVALSQLLKARRFHEYLLLFVSPMGFIPLPDRAFQSEEDRLGFEEALREAKLLPK
ncbi:MAG: YcxB family protein [Fimbriimonadaceae bacterium]|nr:YcxB family protein [Chthonomonadaceae bacterium]MCO5298218.1 YcxB family protein [Fimbriimonadaceae bacterium]